MSATATVVPGVKHQVLRTSATAVEGIRPDTIQNMIKWVYVMNWYQNITIFAGVYVQDKAKDMPVIRPNRHRNKTFIAS